MYPINKLRRKVLLAEGYKTIFVWECFAKYGTQNVCIVYLFAEPKAGEIIQGIKEIHGTPLMNCKVMRYLIDEVQSDGLVRLQLF